MVAFKAKFPKNAKLGLFFFWFLPTQTRWHAMSVYISALFQFVSAHIFHSVITSGFRAFQSGVGGDGWWVAARGHSRQHEINNVSPASYPNASQIFMPLHDFNHLSFPHHSSLHWPLFSPHSQSDWATEMSSFWTTPGATTMPLQSREAFRHHGELSKLCDWLSVHNEVNTVWGLWGANYQREWENNNWIREVSTEKQKETARVGQSTELLIASDQEDLSQEALWPTSAH